MSESVDPLWSPPPPLRKKPPQEFTSIPPFNKPQAAAVEEPPGAVPAATDPPTPAADPVPGRLTPEEIREKQQHPLKRFSLRGTSAHLERVAADQRPLLDSLLLSGQANAWYAPPNTGKSLICLALLMQAIEASRIEGEQVFYVNVDDTSKGLAEKVGFLEQFNVHTPLGEGVNKFTAKALLPAMRELIDVEKADGLFVILDTLKKFVSIMDKKESASFALLCRQFVLKGGTLLALGHTNKRPGSDGKLIYSGTSDIPDDFDCVYLISTRPEQPSETDKVVEFENIKRRGDVDARAVYSYTVREQITYDERLASVSKLDASGFLPVEEMVSAEREAVVVSAIADRIAAAPTQKMQLARDVAASMGLGRHKVIAVINKYTGDDKDTHRWNYKIGHRGVKIYRLLEPTGPDPMQA